MVKIIAEVGSVHDGSFGNACNLIRKIAEAGAWAVKFQHHIASDETTKDAPTPSYFRGESRFDYFERTSFTEEQWKELKKVADEENVKFIVSPFSLASAVFLRKLEISHYKIASGEVTNIPLLDYIAETNIPSILSSGMSTLEELDNAVKKLDTNGNLRTVMQCTSEYPCKHENVGLHIMQEISSRYNLPPSLSDHTVDFNASLIASYLGAEYIERHVTFSRDMYGSDAKHSLTLPELSDLVDNISICRKLRTSQASKDMLTDKVSHMKKIFEKGLYFSRDLKKGHILSSNDVCIKKPSNELSPSMVGAMLGRKLVNDVKLDDPITRQSID